MGRWLDLASYRKLYKINESSFKNSWFSTTFRWYEYNVVIKNSNAIADLIEEVNPLNDKIYLPKIENAFEKGYVIEEENSYRLPEMEDIYFLIPLKTLTSHQQ